MYRDFGGTAFEHEEKGRDRELTLGPMSLIVLAVVLCGVCAVCFVWGYSVGHRGAAESAQQQATTGGGLTSQSFNAPAKPNATQDHAEPGANAQLPAAEPADSARTEEQASSASTATTGSPAASSSGPPVVVQAALPGQEAAMKLATGGGQVQPAITQGGQWMVQIAAVNHQEDADVLVSALRRHGYAVSPRRDPGDNLIHVQVGPFATHADAASMRERLLNDGYNALIEP